MTNDVVMALTALGSAAVCYGAGIFFALRGEGVTAAVLIIAGALLTLAGMR